MSKIQAQSLTIWGGSILFSGQKLRLEVRLMGSVCDES